ncbi:MAG: MBL fold metallo-hydrolase [Dehalococcoidia bacterium]|nr:MBL fold metallo-hydrolase [Dehalococcoidia bacterium]
MLQLGNLSLTLLSDGLIKFDGGVLFGDMPKSSWEQLVHVDRRNRLPVNMNCLLIRSAKHKILVDTGAGAKDVERQREEFGVGPSRLLRELRAVGVSPREIDLVILTHLHFDHCGGATRLDRWGQVVPTFPRATYLVQRGSWEEATTPSERGKVSYDSQDFTGLERTGQVAWLNGDSEVAPGVRVKVTGAHAQGHQIVLVDEGSERVAFLGDLVPTHHHLSLNCIAANDRFPEETLEQKRSYLQKAEREGWLVIFSHSSQGVQAGYVERRNGSHLQVRQVGI